MYKRRIIYIVLASVLAFIFTVGCSKENGQQTEKYISSVSFLDVGQGDCSFIEFSDGKTMLIDCGQPNSKISDYIVDFIRAKKVDRIDYFVLTHPDSDHIGNAVDIINAFSIGTVYIPDVISMHFDLLPLYANTYKLIEEKGISTNVSDAFDVIVGKDYSVAFLSPMPSALSDSAYVDFNQTQNPTDEQVNALSPIMYLELNGVRFVFTGDALKKQEQLALNWLNVGKTHYDYYGVSPNLDSIDFLKVSHHGSSDASGEEFLEKLAPKNAVISVGGSNSYGHPDSEVLTRLFNVNYNMNLYRTDVHGTVRVLIEENSYKVLTDSD